MIPIHFAVSFLQVQFGSRRVFFCNVGTDIPCILTEKFMIDINDEAVGDDLEGISGDRKFFDP